MNYDHPYSFFYDSFSNRGPVPQYETSINFLTKEKLERENINMNDEDAEVIFEDTWSNFDLESCAKLWEIDDFDRLRIQNIH